MILTIIAIVGGSAALSAGLVLALRPWLQRYALARPNARSSHRVPTPQGGGIAVVLALVLALAPWWGGVAAGGGQELGVVLAGVVLIAAVGAVDDLRPLSAGLRLVLQGVLVSAVVIAAGRSGRLMPEGVPLWLEQGILIVAGLWFVNLVNFMDGLDWMTVAEMVPLTAAGALAFAWSGAVEAPGAAALALLGALLGFAPFNRPVARLFLGDVGSLPIGLLTAWLLYRLARDGALAAAVILPLYYLADATITLFRRLLRGEKIWQAHRSHFYQQATDNGFSVPEVVGRIFVLNLALAGLALLALARPSPGWQAAALALAAGLVAVTLARFAAPRRTGVP